jgi:nucleotide-binding universal stress UspA family protein
MEETRMGKILIAVDGSDSSMKAVRYAGRQFMWKEDMNVTILHVLPYPPAPLWDDGHIPEGAEKEARDKAIERWLQNERRKFELFFTTAVEALAGAGVAAERIETRTISDSTDAAASILEAARDGGYETLVLGRRGLSASKRFLLGSVTSKIVDHCSGITLCVVG